MSDENAPGTSKENAEPTGGAQSSAQRSGPDQAAQDAGGATPARARSSRSRPRTRSGPTRAPRAAPARPRPARARACSASAAPATPPGSAGWSCPATSPHRRSAPTAAGSTRSSTNWVPRWPSAASTGAVQQITIDRGEITFYVARERLLDLCRTLRDDEALRFELCSSVSGVDYGADVARRLHVVYHLLSMTYRRRIRLEVALDVDDAHVPSVVEVYPTADWHERETWDMFGVVFDGHPALTRILMPDDWDGHPQRKDYPLGGIPVEYKGAQIPPPDQRRAYS